MSARADDPDEQPAGKDDLAPADEPADLAPTDDQADLAAADDDPPVVARLMVEIRSDGTRTIARGAMEERTTGQRVALEAEAGTPQELTALLLKQLMSTPALTGKAVKDALAAKARGLRRRLTRRLLPGSRRDDPPPGLEDGARPEPGGGDRTP